MGLKEIPMRYLTNKHLNETSEKYTFSVFNDNMKIIIHEKILFSLVKVFLFVLVIWKYVDNCVPFLASLFLQHILHALNLK